MARAAAQLPLTPAVLHVLLALADADRHGYAIMRQVKADSGGAVTLGPGTLYGALKRLLDAGLVAESGSRPDPALDDQRRIYYTLTASGRRTLQAELARLERTLALARTRTLPAPQEHTA